jgi:hypoxanthine-DNA glycosylase
METGRKIGFAPVFDKDSRVLILGSFPSVKSREIDFYYGHKQNRFWKMLCGYFGEEIPATIDGKKAFLQRNHIALWDMVVSCEIQGSSDASVKNAVTADLNEVLGYARIEKILLNGTLSYDLFVKSYADLGVPYAKMPSTSPANPRYDEKIWKEALDDVFGIS